MADSKRQIKFRVYALASEVFLRRGSPLSPATGLNSQSDLPPYLELSKAHEERADNRLCIVSVKPNEISDWLYVDNGKPVGGNTVQYCSGSL
jgi:hypothetical protein